MRHLVGCESGDFGPCRCDAIRASRREPKDVVAALRARACAVFLACDESVASDISKHMLEAAETIEHLREVLKGTGG